jgi:site-specific DNA recombinase
VAAGAHAGTPPSAWSSKRFRTCASSTAELWDAVKARQTVIRESEGVTKARASPFWERRRAQHLLACWAARGRGTCTNRASIRRGPFEDLILEGLRHKLMTGKEVEAFIAAFHAELNAQRAARTDPGNKNAT